LSSSLSTKLGGKRLRLVLDTNVVVSGLLWGGHSRRLLELALDSTVTLYSSPALVDELSQTLRYAKLEKRIAVLQTTAQALVAHYTAMVTLLVPRQVPRVIAQDADDDQVLACAVEAHAHLIASGDQHLHSLGGNYQGVRIVTPAEAAMMLQVL
jgi:putative PIN family toxin of toxin-antitoxin system